jgi:hypothetical protein
MWSQLFRGAENDHLAWFGGLYHFPERRYVRLKHQRAMPVTGMHARPRQPLPFGERDNQCV